MGDTYYEAQRARSGPTRDQNSASVSSELENESCDRFLDDELRSFMDCNQKTWSQVHAPSLSFKLSTLLCSSHLLPQHDSCVFFWHTFCQLFSSDEPSPLSTTPESLSQAGTFLGHAVVCSIPPTHCPIFLRPVPRLHLQCTFAA